MKALLEQPNGLARRILAKAGANPTELLDKTDAFIRQQPRVSGDSQQVAHRLILLLIVSIEPNKLSRYWSSLRELK